MLPSDWLCIDTGDRTGASLLRKQNEVMSGGFIRKKGRRQRQRHGPLLYLVQRSQGNKSTRDRDMSELAA